MDEEFPTKSTNKLVAHPEKTTLDILIVAEIIKYENEQNIIISWTKDHQGEIPLIESTMLYTRDGGQLQCTEQMTRYLARTMHPALYGDTDPYKRTEIDHWICSAMKFHRIRDDDCLKYLNDVLITRTWLVGTELTLADIHMFSVLYSLKYIELYGVHYCHITRWYNHIQSLPVVNNVLSTRAMMSTVVSKTMCGYYYSNLKKNSPAKQTKTRKQEGKFVDLPEAEMGKVVVRFPPEASGYLHIGHAKAALLNQYYAEAFQGQFIMRFDDTNPTKETVEFEEAILEDIKLLQIKPDRFTHTSDYFDILQDYCTTLIKDGKAYVDGTPANLIKEQRDLRLKSIYRDNSIDKNLNLWEKMKINVFNMYEDEKSYCVRAKIDYQSTNGCLRDPIIYRSKSELHPRTGDKYKVYPTYDFACPIVDAIENVTHTLRTTEYRDRDVQFYWIIRALGLRCPYIWEYSRLNMTHTVLSKRKLAWFVNEGLVDGWDDPRFPTVRGILRRGMTVEGLKQFIIAQGSSKSVVFMEWDKIWAFNKKVIDPIAIRYTALNNNELITINVVDAKEEWLSVQNHPKDSSKGSKRVRVGPKILIEKEDAEKLIEGQNATFINWGNLMILKINKQDGNIVDVEARLNLEDKNYKNTLKLTWLAESLPESDPNAIESNPIKCCIVYFDHILRVPILGKDVDFKDFINKNTKKEVQMLGEVELKRVRKGEIIQLQRKGFFICDAAYTTSSNSRDQSIVLFHVPDGHMTSSMMPATSCNHQEANMQSGDIIYRNPLETLEKTLPKFDKTIQFDKLIKYKQEIQNIMKEAGEAKLFPYDPVCGTLRIIKDSLSYPLYLKEINKECLFVDPENYFIHLKDLRKLRIDMYSRLQILFMIDNQRIENNEIGRSTVLAPTLEKQEKEIRDLQRSKADKSIIDVKLNELFFLRSQWESYKRIEDDAIGHPDEKNPEARELYKRCKELGHDASYINRMVWFELNIFNCLSHAYDSLASYFTPRTPTFHMLREISESKNRERDMSEKIKQQCDKIRSLKSLKIDKSIIDREEKILFNMKSDYKYIINQDWKPGNTTIDDIQSDTTETIKRKKEMDPEEKLLTEEIERQYNKINRLERLKADNIDQEKKVLSSLKETYKKVVGREWDIPLMDSATESSDEENIFIFNDDNSEIEMEQEKRISEAEKLSEELQKQCELILGLRDDSILEQHVKTLLNLRKDYQKVIRQILKTFNTTVNSRNKTTESKTTQTKTKEDIEREELFSVLKLSEDIRKQSEKVEDLKSSEDKSNIEQEEKVLLKLKSDYINLVGQHWEPRENWEKLDFKFPKRLVLQDRFTSFQAAIKICKKINKQNDKIRKLEISSTNKKIIDLEMNTLLTLKNHYKSVIGKNWKSIDTVTGIQSEIMIEDEKLLELVILSEEIQTQEILIRYLKFVNSEEIIIDQEKEILLKLKNEYKNKSGQDWKSTKNEKQNSPESKLSLSKSSSEKTPEKEVAENADSKYAEIKKQGDKVRHLKSSKTDKSIVDQEVKILLKLKSDYKDITGQDWKPTNSDASTKSKKQNSPESKLSLSKSSSEKTQEKEVAENADSKYAEIKKQGDKVRHLKSSKADKSIVDQEVKILLKLKSDYKDITGQDWKPTNSDASTKSEKQNSPESKLSLSKSSSEKTPEKEVAENADSKYAEIKKQGDKVRHLKSSKADKSIVDQEVKILLKLKSDYKDITGQDWKPTNSGASTKSEKQNSPESEFSSKVISGKLSSSSLLKSDKWSSTSSPFEFTSTSSLSIPSSLSETVSEEEGKLDKSSQDLYSKKKEVAKNADTGKTGTRLGLEAKKEENFFDWYSQVIIKSGMIEYYDVSGCYILRPWSYSIWNIIKEYINKKITALGVQECYFPIFVTRNVLEKEKAHITDFAPEVAWVTKYGENDLAEPIAIRPTSETVMYPAYAKWLRSDTELPLKLNQWNNVVRWEFKDPKPFLRTREFLWQEGHTAFATKAEAEDEVLIILDMYAKVYEDLLAVPVIKGRKTEKEKFAGGDYTTTVEAFIATNGRAIQGATSHHLGQNFSKMFNIQIEGIADGDEKTFVYQNSWGLTTRTIGVMIMVHGDNKGLVLPPNVAPIQIVVIPCGMKAHMMPSHKQSVMDECASIVDQLKKCQFRVHGDFRTNRTPGWKFNHWELKGVPIRIEFGPKDMNREEVTLVRRDNFHRVVVSKDKLIESVAVMLKTVQDRLLTKAREKLNEHIKLVRHWDAFNPALNEKNLLLSPFCGEPACEDNIKKDSTSSRENQDNEIMMGAKSLCIPFEQPDLKELTCIHHSCKNKPKFYTLFGRSY